MRTINPKPEKDKPQASVRRTAVKGVLLLLLAIALIFYRDTLSEIAKEVRSVTGQELLCSIVLAFLGYWLEGMTIFTMMRAVAPENGARVRDGVFIALVCEFYRLTTLGNGSGFAEIHYLHKKDMETGSATVLTMIQYVMKRTAVMLLGVVGFIYLSHKEAARFLCREYRTFMAAGCLITILIISFFLCVALSLKVTKGLLWIVDRLSSKIKSREENFEKWKEQILLLNSCGKNILGRKQKMVSVILLQTGKLVLFYLIPSFLIGGKIDLTIRECVLVMAVAFMLAGVIPTPSGAGALEFVFLLFFTCFTDSITAASPILIFRFATWVCPAMAGGVLLLGQNIRRTCGGKLDTGDGGTHRWRD